MWQGWGLTEETPYKTALHVSQHSEASIFGNRTAYLEEAVGDVINPLYPENRLGDPNPDFGLQELEMTAN